jgi:hypothetical protein
MRSLLCALVRPDGGGASGHKVIVAAVEQYCDAGKFKDEVQLLLEAVHFLLTDQRAVLLCSLGAADQRSEVSEAMMKVRGVLGCSCCFTCQHAACL